MGAPTAIDATAGSATANSYVTLAAADQYVEDHPNPGTSWSGATIENRHRALIQATRLLDQQVEWTGAPADTTQVLNWPRIGMQDRNGNSLDSDAIPTDLANATAEMARQILADDLTEDSDIETKGVTSLKVGSVAMTFKSTVKAKVLPDAVYHMLERTWIWKIRGRRQMTRRLLRT